MTVPKLRAAIVVFVVGFALGLSVFAATRLFVRSVLSADAASTAEELARRLGEGGTMEEGGTLSAVSRYVYFDASGQEIDSASMAPSQGAGPDRPEAESRQAADAARRGETVILQSPLIPNLLGLSETGVTAVSVPVKSGEETTGAVFVEVDQTRALGSLTRAFSLSGMVAVSLATLGVILVALAVTRGAGFGGRRAFDPRSLPRDPLTGLITRDGFKAALADSVRRADAAGNQIGLMIVDLQGVRPVNEVWGHATGDAVLKAAADRLRGFASAPTALGRIAGADFALVVEDEGNAHSLRALAAKIRDALRAPYRIGGHSIDLQVRMGAALFPVNAEDAEFLFRAADTALSRAKREKQDDVVFFDTEMEKRLQRRSELERDLRQALEREEFVVFYQPQLELSSGRLRGYEALVRWERPGEGILSPRDFLPVAVETGLITPIGEWVLRKACRDAATWLDAETVAVNFSPAQFRVPDLDKLIAAILTETGLAPQRLEIEVPESLFLQSAPDKLDMLKRIKALGVRIAMDDFGGGYTGLASLARFPFDKVKIDKSFVNQVAEDSDVAAIVASIVALGRLLSLDITAEGVETEEQVTMLKAAGCSTVQGFLFGGPRRDGARADGADKASPAAAVA